MAGGTYYNTSSTPMSLFTSAVWVYDGYSTVRVGLTGTGYSNTSMTLEFFNDLNQAAGTTTLEGGLYTGSAGWFYDGASTSRVGYFDSNFTSSAGEQYTRIRHLTNQGELIGDSQLYNAYNANAKVTWIYDGNSTKTLGLSGAGFTDPNGYQYSEVVDVNANGQILGQSTRFQGATLKGRAAWIYESGVTKRIGLTGSGFTRNDDVQTTYALDINSHGQAVGYSLRFNNSTRVGHSAWLYDGINTIELPGLTGAKFVRADGYQSNVATLVSDQGHVAGYSTQYNGWVIQGNATWVYDGNATTRIGLIDSVHTRASDGFQENHVEFLNNQGQVAGSSQRYNGDANVGRDVWFYDGVDTTQLGLSGADYTNTNDGTRLNWLTAVNDQGVVAGYTNRFNGDVATGQTAWVYYSSLDQTFEFNLSQNSSGYSQSTINYLGDDGVVLGSYFLFDDNVDSAFPAPTEGRVFYFTPETGVMDLMDYLLLSGHDISAEGWESLDSFLPGVDGEYLFGTGIKNGVGVPYLLTPSTAVPIPAAAWMFGTALLGLMSLKRNRLA